MSEENWVVSEFAESCGVGKLRSTDSQAEVGFQLEAWLPCDPATARALQDSEQRRRLLLPQIGEPVDVSWKQNQRGERVLVRVSRRTQLVRTLPPIRFDDWLARIGKHINHVASWGREEWDKIAGALDENISDTIYATQKEAPERHIGLLAWLAKNAPKSVVERRLSWIHESAGSGRFAVEAQGESDVVFLELPEAVFEHLVAEQLVYPSSV